MKKILYLLLLLTLSSAQAENVIKFVVPYPAGTFTDNLVRVVKPALEKETNSTILVENKPGAATNIGTKYVATSNPDNIVLEIQVGLTVATTAGSGAYELDGANFIAYNSSQTYIIGRSAGLNSNILLDSAYTSSDAWGLSVATGNSPSDTTRGRFELVTYTGSNQLLAKQSIPFTAPNDQ